MDNSHPLLSSTGTLLERVGRWVNITGFVCALCFSMFNLGTGAAWWTIFKENRLIVQDDNPYQDVAFRLMFMSALLILAALLRRNRVVLRQTAVVFVVGVATHQSLLLWRTLPYNVDSFIAYSMTYRFYETAAVFIIALTWFLLLIDLVSLGCFFVGGSGVSAKKSPLGLENGTDRQK